MWNKPTAWLVPTLPELRHRESQIKERLPIAFVGIISGLSPVPNWNPASGEGGEESFSGVTPEERMTYMETMETTGTCAAGFQGSTIAAVVVAARHEK